MPVIYLSPSTQEWNAYVTGSGSEEYHMNQLADALVPYLWSNAIRYQRNRPDMTAASSIREGNAGDYDLSLALHSNAAPEGHYGEERGIIAFYYPGSQQGQRAAELIVEELRQIYPLPNKVTTRETTSLGEVRQPRACGGHCAAAGPGPDPVFRSSLYLPVHTGDGDCGGVLWDAESAGLPLF